MTELIRFQIWNLGHFCLPRLPRPRSIDSAGPGPAGGAGGGACLLFGAWDLVLSYSML
jgi:hypothetical protein